MSAGARIVVRPPRGTLPAAVVLTAAGPALFWYSLLDPVSHPEVGSTLCFYWLAGGLLSLAGLASLVQHAGARVEIDDGATSEWSMGAVALRCRTRDIEAVRPVSGGRALVFRGGATIALPDRWRGAPEAVAFFERLIEARAAGAGEGGSGDVRETGGEAAAAGARGEKALPLGRLAFPRICAGCGAPAGRETWPLAVRAAVPVEIRVPACSRCRFRRAAAEAVSLPLSLALAVPAALLLLSGFGIFLAGLAGWSAGLLIGCAALAAGAAAWWLAGRFVDDARPRLLDRWFLGVEALGISADGRRVALRFANPTYARAVEALTVGEGSAGEASPALPGTGAKGEAAGTRLVVRPPLGAVLAGAAFAAVGPALLALSLLYPDPWSRPRVLSGALDIWPAAVVLSLGGLWILARHAGARIEIDDDAISERRMGSEVRRFPTGDVEWLRHGSRRTVVELRGGGRVAIPVRWRGAREATGWILRQIEEREPTAAVAEAAPPAEARPIEPAEARAPPPAETRAPQPAETRAPPPAETRAPPPAETRAPPPAEARAPRPAVAGSGAREAPPEALAAAAGETVLPLGRLALPPACVGCGAPPDGTRAISARAAGGATVEVRIPACRRCRRRRVAGEVASYAASLVLAVPLAPLLLIAGAAIGGFPAPAALAGLAIAVGALYLVGRLVNDVRPRLLDRWLLRVEAVRAAADGRSIALRFASRPYAEAVEALVREGREAARPASAEARAPADAGAGATATAGATPSGAEEETPRPAPAPAPAPAPRSLAARLLGAAWSLAALLFALGLVFLAVANLAPLHRAPHETRLAVWFVASLAAVVGLVAGYRAAMRRGGLEAERWRALRALAGTLGVGAAGLLVLLVISEHDHHHEGPRSNEAAAIGALRTLTTAQALFREADKDRDGTLDYSTSLAALESAKLIDVVLGSGTKQGYKFSIIAADQFTWSGAADPVRPGRTGDRYFLVDESGVIRFSTTREAIPRDLALWSEEPGRELRGSGVVLDLPDGYGRLPTATAEALLAGAERALLRAIGESGGRRPASLRVYVYDDDREFALAERRLAAGRSGGRSAFTHAGTGEVHVLVPPEDARAPGALEDRFAEEIASAVLGRPVPSRGPPVEREPEARDGSRAAGARAVVELRGRHAGWSAAALLALAERVVERTASDFGIDPGSRPFHIRVFDAQDRAVLPRALRDSGDGTFVDPATGDVDLTYQPRAGRLEGVRAPGMLECLLAERLASAVFRRAYRSWGDAPEWLTEGLAELAAERAMAGGAAPAYRTVPWFAAYVHDLRDAVESGALLPIARLIERPELPRTFHPNLPYAEALSLVRLLDEAGGPERRAAFRAILGEMASLEPGPAVAVRVGARFVELLAARGADGRPGLEALESEIREWARSAGALPWHVVARDLRVGADGSLAVESFPGHAAMAISTGPALPERARIDAEVTIDDQGGRQADIIFSYRGPRDFWKLALVSGGDVTLLRFDGAWRTIANAKVPPDLLRPGVPHRITVGVGRRALPTWVDGKLAFRFGLQEGTFGAGRHGIGAYDGCAVFRDVRASRVTGKEEEEEEEEEKKTQEEAEERIDASTWVMNYYRRPEPDRLVERVREIAEGKWLSGGGRPEAHVMFLGKVMERNPARIAGWLDALSDLGPEDLAVLHRAAWTSGTAEAKAWLVAHGQAALAAEGPPPLLSAEPMIFEPYHLDSLWEWFFATGEDAPVRRVVSFFDHAPEMPPPDSLDLPRLPADRADPIALARVRIAYPAVWSAAMLAVEHDRVLEVLRETSADPSLGAMRTAWAAQAVRIAVAERAKRPGGRAGLPEPEKWSSPDVIRSARASWPRNREGTEFDERGLACRHHELEALNTLALPPEQLARYADVVAHAYADEMGRAGLPDPSSEEFAGEAIPRTAANLAYISLHAGEAATRELAAVRLRALIDRQRSLQALLVGKWVSDDDERIPLEFLEGGTARAPFYPEGGVWRMQAGTFTVSAGGRVSFYYCEPNRSGSDGWRLEDGVLIGSQGPRPLVRWVKAKGE